MSSSANEENECPVCKDTIKNSSEPSPCCGKIFCQTCLTQSVRVRPHCPYCRSSLSPAAENGGTGAIRPFSVPRNRRVALPGIDTSFRATRPVGSNIQHLLDQLRNTHNQPLTTVEASTAPVPQNPPPASTAPQRRPTPRPRLRTNQNVATPPPLQLPRLFAPVQSPLPLVATPNPLITPHVSEDDINWASEIVLMESAQRQLSGPSSVRTFQCPYCEQDGLDDLDLLDHCNDNHLTDTRRVVCPVCVSLPHGDQQYYSRDFIGHLNLRHCYYIEDITNIHQSDDVNMQAAILASLSQAS